jgi:predicted RNase H-like nuclease (RuvC/YqgF family)
LAGKDFSYNVGQKVELKDDAAKRLVAKGYATYVVVTDEEVEAQRKAELANNKEYTDLIAKYEELEKAGVETLKQFEALKAENEALKAELESLKAKGKK